jgi:hypothetical protein
MSPEPRQPISQLIVYHHHRFELIGELGYAVLANAPSAGVRVSALWSGKFLDPLARSNGTYDGPHMKRKLMHDLYGFGVARP